jgi:hypothetical protein
MHALISQCLFLGHIHPYDNWYLFPVDLRVTFGALVNDRNVDSGHARDLFERGIG